MNKISVVIPTFNRAHILESVVSSVVNQSLIPLEIIIVDDGSTDSTKDVAKDLIAKNDKLNIRYVSQENQGGNVARNRGIEEAKSELIAFLDSDDTWDKEKLEKQYNEFKRNPTLGAVYCGLRHVDLANGKVLQEPKRSFPQGDLSRTLLIRDVTAPTSCYMVKKSVFEDVGYFDVNLKARQDWEMWIRIAQKYPIGAVSEILVNFGEHQGPRTASNPQKEIDAYSYIRVKYKNDLNRLPFVLRQKANSAFYRRMGKVANNYQGKKLKSMVWFIRACMAWPFAVQNWFGLFGLGVSKNIKERLFAFWNRILGKTTLSLTAH